MEKEKLKMTKENFSERATHEVAHGKKLSAQNVEKIWGWETPAGKIRAKRRAEMIIARAEIKPGKRILEIGCGTGIFTEYFSKTNANILAVDISQDLISTAEERFSSNKRVEFLCQAFEDLDTDEHFDAIVGSSVLHHLDIENALAVIHKLLKPGGRLSFAEPNLLNPQVFSMFTFLRKRFDYVSQDEKAFTRWSIKKKLNKFGFVKVKTIPFDWLHPSTPKRLIPQINTLGSLLEKLPVIREFAGSMLISGRRPN